MPVKPVQHRRNLVTPHSNSKKLQVLQSQLFRRRMTYNKTPRIIKSKRFLKRRTLRRRIGKKQYNIVKKPSLMTNKIKVNL